MNKAVVLLSGGLDSAVCATRAVHVLGNKNVHGLCVQYGQTHDKEVFHAMKIAQALQLGSHETITLPSELYANADCALLRQADEIPDATYEDLQRNFDLDSVYVPFRNGILTSIGTAYAYQLGAKHIYFGAHMEDADTNAYPDTTVDFFKHMHNSIIYGTDGKVSLRAPFILKTKTDVISEGSNLGAPFEETYSCYKGGDRHCGECPTCRSRIEAFKKAGVMDPVEYDIDVDWEGLENQINLNEGE